MIYITEPNKNEIIFQFFIKELPDDVTPSRTTKMTNIQYNGGHQTNQLFGVFDDPIEWTGVMVGTYHINGKVLTAKERLEELKKLQGRPLGFGFPVPTKGDKIPGLSPTLETDARNYKNGDKGIYIIEKITPKVKNHLNIEYTIRLVPHQRAEKIKPTETTRVKVEVNSNIPKQNSAKIKGAAAASTKLNKANNVANQQPDLNANNKPSINASRRATNDPNLGSNFGPQQPR